MISPLLMRMITRTMIRAEDDGDNNTMMICDDDNNSDDDELVQLLIKPIRLYMQLN